MERKRHKHVRWIKFYKEDKWILLPENIISSCLICEWKVGDITLYEINPGIYQANNLIPLCPNHVNEANKGIIDKKVMKGLLDKKWLKNYKRVLQDDGNTYRIATSSKSLKKIIRDSIEDDPELNKEIKSLLDKYRGRVIESEYELLNDKKEINALCNLLNRILFDRNLVLVDSRDKTILANLYCKIKGSI